MKPGPGFSEHAQPWALGGGLTPVGRSSRRVRQRRPPGRRFSQVRWPCRQSASGPCCRSDMAAGTRRGEHDRSPPGRADRHRADVRVRRADVRVRRADVRVRRADVRTVISRMCGSVVRTERAANGCGDRMASNLELRRRPPARAAAVDVAPTRQGRGPSPRGSADLPAFLTGCLFAGIAHANRP